MSQALRASVGHLQAIDGPPVRPPAYGLLVAADVIESGVTWQQGVEWAPEQIFGGRAQGVDCLGSTPDGDPTRNPITNTAEPFAVSANDSCSTFGWEARDYEGRARRQLLSVQSALIANEFQVGTIRTADGLANVALEDGTLVSPSPASPANALAELEGVAGQFYGGKRAMIHCSPQTFTLLARDHIPVFVGGKWVTPMGSIIVADAGYMSPDATHEFMYLTTMVQVRLGEVLLVPGSLAEARAYATDRATNLTTIIAERLALVQVDASDITAADSIFKVEVNTTPVTVP